MLNMLHVDLGLLPSLPLSLLLTLILILPNDSHFLGTGRASVELVPEPVAGELSRQLETDHARSKAEHLGIVGEDGTLDGEGVVGCHGADAGDFVGGDGDAEA